jgi:hypothetical protein
MDLSTASREFAIRLYRWALEEWTRELHDGFPQLNMLTGNSALMAMELFRSLDGRTQSQLACAMTKRFHKEACDYLGEPLDDSEVELLRWADSRRMSTPSPRRPLRVEKSVRKATVASLRGELRFLGPPDSLGSAAEWRHTTTSAAWRVVTYVDVTGPFGDCSYSQSVETMDGATLRRNLSVLSWLGVSSSSSWRIRNHDDVATVASGVAGLCRYFLDMAPLLLRGLVVDS